MNIDPVKIRKMVGSDWSEVKRIYQQGIDSENSTFETKAPAYKEWDQTHLSDCRFVAIYQDTMAGWAALSPVSERCVYEGVAEVSVYVDEQFRGKGIGSKLLTKLITDSEVNGIWTLQAGMFPENNESVRLHQKHGFRTLGVREKLGKLNGNWRDVVLMEKRSNDQKFQ